MVKGFEKIASQHEGNRIGHDYNQVMVQTGSDREREAFYSKVPKKLIVLTHIGRSRGENAYLRGIKNAQNSHFRDGFFELDQADEGKLVPVQ